MSGFVVPIGDNAHWIIEITSNAGQVGIAAQRWIRNPKTGEFWPQRGQGVWLPFGGRLVDDPLGNERGLMTQPRAVIESLYAMLEHAEV